MLLRGLFLLRRGDRVTRGRILPSRRDLRRQLVQARREAEDTRQALRSAMDALDQAHRELEAYGRITALSQTRGERVPPTASYGHGTAVSVYGYGTAVSVSPDPGAPS